MKVSEGKLKGFRPITIELESEEEVKILMNILDPNETTSLERHCKIKDLDLNEVVDFKIIFWNALNNKLKEVE